MLLIMLFINLLVRTKKKKNNTHIHNNSLILLKGIDKQKPEVIGMAFVLGVYAFGAYGVLLGPLVSGNKTNLKFENSFFGFFGLGALLALIDIYKAYLPNNEDSIDPSIDEMIRPTKTDSLGF